MNDLITSFTALFNFLITQMSAVATFFTSNDLGRIVLFVSLFTLVINVVLSIINKVRGR